MILYHFSESESLSVTFPYCFRTSMSTLCQKWGWWCLSLLRGRSGWWWWNTFQEEGDSDDGIVQQARGARRHSGEMEGNNQSVPGSPLRWALLFRCDSISENLPLSVPLTQWLTDSVGQSVGQSGGQWFIVSDLEIAIASPSFASLLLL